MMFVLFKIDELALSQAAVFIEDAFKVYISFKFSAILVRLSFLYDGWMVILDHSIILWKLETPHTLSALHGHNHPPP